MGLTDQRQTRIPTKREINYLLPTGKILTNGHCLSKAGITLGSIVIK